MRCQQGDPVAFRELVHQYERIVFHTIASMIGDTTEADDVAQDVFIRVHRSIKDFRGQSQFSAWLHRITVNQCLDRIKSRKRRPESVSLDQLMENMNGAVDVLFRDPAPDAAERLDQTRLQEAIQAVLNSLSPEHRAVVILKDIEGRSQEEIAEILDCPLGTVKSRLTRAREALKDRLRPFYDAWKA